MVITVRYFDGDRHPDKWLYEITRPQQTFKSFTPTWAQPTWLEVKESQVFQAHDSTPGSLSALKWASWCMIYIHIVITWMKCLSMFNRIWTFLLRTTVKVKSTFIFYMVINYLWLNIVCKKTCTLHVIIVVFKLKN